MILIQLETCTIRSYHCIPNFVANAKVEIVTHESTLRGCVLEDVTYLALHNSPGCPA